MSSTQLLLSLLSAATAFCPAKVLYEAPVGTWFENIAVRQNGSLLVTSLGSPGGLYTLNPFSSRPTLDPVITTFPGVNSTLGLAETIPDVFYVLGNNFSLDRTTLGVLPGTNAVYKVDLSSDTEPELTTLVNLPDASFFNGLTKFLPDPKILLAADSALGVIWAIDTHTGAHRIAARDPLMDPIPDPPGSFAEGINGIHMHPSQPEYVYFTNSQQKSYSRVRLSPNATQIGPAELIADSITQSGVEVKWDDFAFDEFGNTFVATEMGNGVQRVRPDGLVEVIAGALNSTLLAEPTSTAFGRTARDRDILYVVTSGGLGYPVYVDGEPKRLGAQIVAVDVGKCGGRGLTLDTAR